MGGGEGPVRTCPYGFTGYNSPGDGLDPTHQGLDQAPAVTDRVNSVLTGGHPKPVL